MPPRNKGKLDLKYNFRSTDDALNRKHKGKCLECGKRIKIALWKKGIDRDYCKIHAEMMHEKEANEYVEKLEREETLKLLKEIKDE